MNCKPLTQEQWQASVAETFNSAVESAYRDMIDKAVKAEREACAKAAEESHMDNMVGEIWAGRAAAAIRARGKV